MELSRSQFREWSDFDPTDYIRVPKSRFSGISGLYNRAPKGRIIITGQIRDDVDEAIHYANNWQSRRPVMMPINNLLALHHIHRNTARRLFSSISHEGYDPEEPISVIADENPDYARDYGVIWNGHHRALAARAAGHREIPAIITPSHIFERKLGEMGYDL